MYLKNDDVLMYLGTFGFTCEEQTQEGFLRFSKRIGDLVVTIASGQFENKIRISMLQDKNGSIRTSYQDIMAYTDMIGEMMTAGLIKEESVAVVRDMELLYDYAEEIDDMDNPLLGLPKKPKGFMAQ